MELVVNRLHRSALGLLALFWVALLAQPTAAQQTTELFGSSGELYRVHGGTFADLFGSDPANNPLGVAEDTVVLALDVIPTDEEPSRLLVPSTEGGEVETLPSLVYDAGQLFLFWSSRVDELHSRLNLIGFDSDQWTETIDISGDPTQLKGMPHMSITRDPLDDSALAQTRTIVHFVWHERRADDVDVLYTPILLIGGQYLGWNPVIELDRYDGNARDEYQGAGLALFQAATIENGTDGRSVVVALPRKETSRLLTLRFRVLPESLKTLANDSRSHVIGVGRSHPHRGSILRLADAMRSHVIGTGVSLHDGVRQYIADEVYRALLGYGAIFDPESMDEIGDLVWQTTLEAGASLLGHPMRSADLPCDLMHIGSTPGAGSEHQIEVCLASDRPLPATANGRHSIHLSESGEEVLVAWEGEEGALVYSESDGDGWSEPVTVSTDSSISFEQAVRILSEQVRFK